MSATKVQQGNIKGPDANAGKIKQNWGDGGSMTSSLPVTFELVLTDDLPNGPYGELAGMSGKLYVSPGMTYDAVAGALIAAWIKSRGDMMKMTQTKMGGGTIKEDWKVISIEYKGGNVDANGQAVAGNHNAKLGITQTASTNCCVVS